MAKFDDGTRRISIIVPMLYDIVFFYVHTRAYYHAYITLGCVGYEPPFDTFLAYLLRFLRLFYSNRINYFLVLRTLLERCQYKFPDVSSKNGYRTYSILLNTNLNCTLGNSSRYECVTDLQIQKFSMRTP